MSNNTRVSDLSLQPTPMAPALQESPVQCLEGLIPIRGCRQLVITYLGDMDVIRTLGNQKEIERVCYLTLDAFVNIEAVKEHKPITRFLTSIPQSIVEKGPQAVLDTLLKTAMNALRNPLIAREAGELDTRESQLIPSTGLIAAVMEVIEDDALINFFATVICHEINEAEDFLESIESLSDAEMAKKIREWMSENSEALKRNIGEATLRGEKEACLGVLPPEIELLSNLRDLDLTNHGLTVLPNAITKLPLLKHLDIEASQLTALPEDLTGLKTLKTLDLSNNELEKLPDSLGTLPLTWLCLSGNPEVVLTSPCIEVLKQKGCNISTKNMK